MDQNDGNFDFTKQAADYLRKVSKDDGLCSNIGSSHAHMLVAAALGYNSRKAMLDDPKGPYTKNQWLSHTAKHVEKIRATILRMKGAYVRPEHAPEIARIIQDGLTPACCECGEHNIDNLPIGYVEQGDDADWVCASCSADDTQYGTCYCCGDHVIYTVEQLDAKGLCSEHHGEFDLDSEEEEDYESYIEYLEIH